MNNNYVIVGECASGNESVGTQWYKTMIINNSFIDLEEIFKWAEQNNVNGKIILTKAKAPK